MCRNPKSAEEAKAEIVADSKNDDVHVHILDISEPASIKKFANDFTERFGSHLNCLINNAGCMVNQREVGQAISSGYKQVLTSAPFVSRR